MNDTPLHWPAHLQDWMRYLALRMAEFEAADDWGGKVKLQRQLACLHEVSFGAVTDPAVFMALLDPEQTAAAPEALPEVAQWRQLLDEAQQSAVRAVLRGSPLTLIQGPPGTGKTTVITEAVLQWLERAPQARVLIVSETHVAVDNVLERLLALDPALDALRIATNPDKIDDDPDVQRASAHRRLADYFEWLYTDPAVPPGLATSIRDLFSAKGAPVRVYRDLANATQVVVATCNLVAAWPFSADDPPFDLVVVDEVCKATLPEVLVPMTRGRHVLLVGDPKQLPPVFCMEDIELQDREELGAVREQQYINQLFERLAPRGHVHLLSRQYRMPNELGDFISEVFYDGRLRNGCNRPRTDALCWVDSDHPELVPAPGSTTVCNRHEVALVLELIEHLVHEHGPASGLALAVITPYRGQQRALRDALVDAVPSGWQMQVDTVDAFQGRDADIVIFSIGRNHGTRRFLADARRMNVALSRARQQLWFIGSLRFLSPVPYLKALHRRAGRHVDRSVGRGTSIVAPASSVSQRRRAP